MGSDPAHRIYIWYSATHMQNYIRAHFTRTGDWGRRYTCRHGAGCLFLPASWLPHPRTERGEFDRVSPLAAFCSLVAIRNVVIHSTSWRICAAFNAPLSTPATQSIQLWMTRIDIQFCLWFPMTCVSPKLEILTFPWKSVKNKYFLDECAGVISSLSIGMWYFFPLSGKTFFFLFRARSVWEFIVFQYLYRKLCFWLKIHHFLQLAHILNMD